MKIALLGYGKMGKTIEQLALDKGHEIVLKVDVENALTWTNEELEVADVAIEFTNPESAAKNILRCFECKTPVVVGTTGWLDQLEMVKENCLLQKGGFFYASNFSIGVNIFFRLNQQLAQMMNDHEGYEIMLEEIHHTQKLDAPSGTAITLAEGILQKLASKEKWVKEAATKSEDLSIFSKRIEDVPGTHIIRYDSEVDSIEIKHTAHSRLGFAKGALMAAEWMSGKEGIFGMEDLLNG